MSKVPRAGYTKTRLMERLSGRNCAAFHSACLLDLARTVEQTGLTAYLYYTGGSPWEFPASEAMGKLIKRPQLGRDLGERLYNAALEVLTLHDGLIFMGADLPSLSLTTLNEAIRQLALYDTVVGPAEDGGYYLLGIKQAYLELFSEIDWGTSKVKEATLAKIKSLGLSVTLLETARDIDTWDDLLEFFKGSLSTKQLRELHSFRFVKQLIAAQSPSVT
ncbi:MAG: TIGR04282 family arsenosugar biosynthesis glycosyltransferase [Desulfitobacteriaceae bacterium]